MSEVSSAIVTQAKVFHGFTPEFVKIHRPFIQFYTLMTGAFKELFKPNIDKSPSGLRAHKATPNPTGKRGHKKESKSGQQLKSTQAESNPAATR